MLYGTQGSHLSSPKGSLRNLKLTKSTDRSKFAAGSQDNLIEAKAEAKPKKQPSELLNLFSAIKKVPTLDERRAIEKK